MRRDRLNLFNWAKHTEGKERCMQGLLQDLQHNGKDSIASLETLNPHVISGLFREAQQRRDPESVVRLGDAFKKANVKLDRFHQARARELACGARCVRGTAPRNLHVRLDTSQALPSRTRLQVGIIFAQQLLVDGPAGSHRIPADGLPMFLRFVLTVLTTFDALMARAAQHRQ